ncbi:hypothetical protein FGO68_gene15665 [Halteria grandinella]|uniref:Uncharacterized protein n=1 Tax=Halteria grandinella TaxID=5974 RepID=A0A8J8T1P5_HALGN|nr:hypothetical protein FGO68_gene15665 [Halteria grandinella]
MGESLTTIAKTHIKYIGAFSIPFLQLIAILITNYLIGKHYQPEFLLDSTILQLVLFLIINLFNLVLLSQCGEIGISDLTMVGLFIHRQRLSGFLFLLIPLAFILFNINHFTWMLSILPINPQVVTMVPSPLLTVITLIIYHNLTIFRYSIPSASEELIHPLLLISITSTVLHPLIAYLFIGWGWIGANGPMLALLLTFFDELIAMIVYVKVKQDDFEEIYFLPNWDCFKGLWEQTKRAYVMGFVVVIQWSILQVLSHSKDQQIVGVIENIPSGTLINGTVISTQYQINGQQTQYDAAINFGFLTILTVSMALQVLTARSISEEKENFSRIRGYSFTLSAILPILITSLLALVFPLTPTLQHFQTLLCFISLSLAIISFALYPLLYLVNRLNLTAFFLLFFTDYISNSLATQIIQTLILALLLACLAYSIRESEHKALSEELKQRLRKEKRRCEQLYYGWVENNEIKQQLISF